MSVEWTLERWHVDRDSMNFLCVWAVWPSSEGRVSSEALCCPLLGTEPHPPFPHSAGMAAVCHYITGVWVILLSPTLLLSFCFSSWHKADKVWLWLISPAADEHRSLTWPTGNYCSIIIDGNQRWGLITPAVTWCSVCLPLSRTLSLSLQLSFLLSFPMC